MIYFSETKEDGNFWIFAALKKIFEFRFQLSLSMFSLSWTDTRDENYFGTNDSNIIFRSGNNRSLSGSSCLGCSLLRFARADFFSKIAERDIFHSFIGLDSLQKILPNWLLLYKSVFHMSSILVKYNFRLS